MANPPQQRTQQVPHHVTALLSHLTSRPGVQSTLILSRKDGSIIQSTGQLAAQETNSASRAVPPAASATTDPNPLAQPSEAPPASPAASTPYQPSQAETLAAHIFNFVSSASVLGVSLSRPMTSSASNEHSSTTLDGEYESYRNGTGTSTPREKYQDAETGDREEDDEVKLLRMRTRKHEIVVVPDRKYLLCVVHDTASANAGSMTGTRSSR
ncbi:hypothetical protein N7462_001127 [Penicillium macrosclerotiorum]|uniref:uncharacterized protein n=1 Tax=Penicillium macrosclerotiorum TaxID=303699 RepID=UPI002548064F|nr:uncharacterized protein N7462_001127 [Penicillium macrosclerotiorum]KAJ5699122.1 hypothetical protein N7462_001127 [Penicillium macrosclerotiorum]